MTVQEAISAVKQKLIKMQNLQNLTFWKGTLILTTRSGDGNLVKKLICERYVEVCLVHSPNAMLNCAGKEFL